MVRKSASPAPEPTAEAATVAPVEDSQTPPTEAQAAPATEAKPDEQYDLHIILHGANIDEKLKDAATVAFRLGLITKPTMAQLMSLFIGWGLALLKQQWLERVGYR